MKRFIFALVFILIILSSASAQAKKECVVEGTIDTIVQNMNLIAEMLNLLGDRIGPEIDVNKCSFEITNYQKGLYTCPINASTGMWVFTDKYLNAEVIQIYGPAENDKPKKTTYDWAYVASNYACMNMKMPDVEDMFISAWNNGYYENSNIEFICGIDPYLDNTWVYIIANK